MIADMHRARMLAWSCQSLGGKLRYLLPMSPSSIQIVANLNPKGFSSHNKGPLRQANLPARLYCVEDEVDRWRAFRPILKEGRALLNGPARFDLVYISNDTVLSVPTRSTLEESYWRSLCA